MNAADTASTKSTGSMVIEIGHGEFRFNAAHSGLHEGEFEPLHGHTYLVRLRLSGKPGEDGMWIDFADVKAALRTAIAPLRRRTLIAERAVGTTILRDGDTVSVACRRKQYVFPACDVVLLPVTNTTTEELAAYVLDRFLANLPLTPPSTVELELAESPGTAARVRADIEQDDQ